MAQSPNILILILSTKDRRYDNFIQVCKNTWVQRIKNKSIKCIFYQGDADGDFLESDTLNLTANDSLTKTSQKLVDAFRFLEREGFEYDYIFRTNLSSYIYVENLLEFIKQNQNDNLYAGQIGTFTTILSSANKFDITREICMKIFKRHTLRFVSGSGILLSHNNVKKILFDKKLKLDLIDDVMIGECLSRHGVQIKEASRIELNDNKITYSNDIKELPELKKKCYHIRLKSKDRSIDVNRFFTLNKYDYYPFDIFDPTLL